LYIYLIIYGDQVDFCGPGRAYSCGLAAYIFLFKSASIACGLAAYIYMYMYFFFRAGR